MFRIILFSPFFPYKRVFFVERTGNLFSPEVMFVRGLIDTLTARVSNKSPRI